MNYYYLFFLLLVGCYAVDDSHTDVMSALEEGEKNLGKKEAEELIAKLGEFLHSQQANEESQELQRSGDLLQEASKLLAQKWGTDNLSNLSNVDITPFLSKSMFLKRRGKRAAKCVKESTNCALSLYKQYRSITGICNNMKIDGTLGKAVTPTRRLLLPTSYMDGLSTIRNRSVTGSPLPSAREISNALFDEKGKSVEDNKMTHFHMQFGQYVAHDIIFMPSSSSSTGEQLDCSQCSSAKTDLNCQPIPIPTNDKYFKKGSCMGFTRSLNGQKTLGVRTQINQNTHFVDLSTVYGSEECEAASVRSFKEGQLKFFTSRDNYVLPPQDQNDTHNVCQSKSPDFCFVAGDFRNSLHPALIPLHITYIKEHNRIAKLFKSSRPKWSDEKLFQETRRIMIGRHQHHVYSQYLPTLLTAVNRRDFGLLPLAIGFHKYYEPTIPPTLSTEFAAAAFRFGHSQARKDFALMTNKNETVGAAVDLGQNIFYTESLYRNRACATMMNGLMLTPAMKVDRRFSDPIRNQMFELRGRKGSGVDLSAVNIMRGRDVGLLPYNQYRQRVGLKKANDFDDLRGEMTANDIKALSSVYKSVDDIDLYAGILTEKPLAGTLLGPTGQYIIADTFFALKKGDRFFYENQVPDELAEIRKSTPAKLYCMTNDDMALVPENVFLINSRRVPCDSLHSLNIQAFLAAAGS